MTREELIQFLRDNLTIYASDVSDQDGWRGIEITLSLCGEEIASTRATVDCG